jgi:uncharacterized protein YjbJ (UPF0337 family)
MTRNQAAGAALTRRPAAHFPLPVLGWSWGVVDTFGYALNFLASRELYAGLPGVARPRACTGTFPEIGGFPAQPHRGNRTQERTMNWDRIEGNWKQFKGKVQQQWGKLTDDDLDVVDGKRMELAGRIQERYGVGKDQAEREIDSWLSSAR